MILFTFSCSHTPISDTSFNSNPKFSSDEEYLSYLDSKVCNDNKVNELDNLILNYFSNISFFKIVANRDKTGCRYCNEHSTDPLISKETKIAAYYFTQIKQKLNTTAHLIAKNKEFKKEDVLHKWKDNTIVRTCMSYWDKLEQADNDFKSRFRREVLSAIKSCTKSCNESSLESIGLSVSPQPNLPLEVLENLVR